MRELIGILILLFVMGIPYIILWLESDDISAQREKLSYVQNTLSNTRDALSNTCDTLSNTRDTLSNTRDTLSNIRKTLSDIKDKSSTYTITNQTFQDWCSSNHDDYSESHRSYSFWANSGDELTFNYFVSSEPNCDHLLVILKGDSISEIKLLDLTGKLNKYYKFTFDVSGHYTLYVQYTKDSSESKFNDNAGIANIHLLRNLQKLLESIHSISS